MDRQGFLDALQQCLSDLPQEDVARSLEYYEEMLDDRIEDGLTEQEAVEQIGTPSEIADRIRMEMPLQTLVRTRAKAKRLKGWEIALLILGSPVWFPLVLSVLVILLSLYVVLWSLLLSLYAVDLSLAAAALASVGLSIWTILEQDILHGTFLLGAGLICAAFTILLFLVSKGATKGVCRGTAAFVRKCKRRIVGRGNAS